LKTRPEQHLLSKLKQLRPKFGLFQEKVEAVTVAEGKILRKSS
jgi:hypothetical protein